MTRVKKIEGSPFEAHRRLVYVTDSEPGITRRGAGRGFYYLDPEGKKIVDAEIIERIRYLAIPPAYDDVWICPLANGHLQATGRDERNRKQYRYHPAWTEKRQKKKYHSLMTFARRLPRIRRRVALHLQRDGLTRERVLAAVVRLLEATHIRIGNQSYAVSNHSFGLTTLKRRHVVIEGSVINFQFVGKSGRKITAEARHPTIAKILSQCQELPGQHLVCYTTEDGEVRPVTSTDVNEYIRQAADVEDVSAKDFRTWNGTVACAQALAQLGPAEGQAATKRQIVTAVKETAQVLRNRPATCRAYYIHPRIFSAYESGDLARVFAAPAPLLPAHSKIPGRYRLHDDERRVLKLLETEGSRS